MADEEPTDTSEVECHKRDDDETAETEDDEPFVIGHDHDAARVIPRWQ